MNIHHCLCLLTPKQLKGDLADRGRPSQVAGGCASGVSGRDLSQKP